MADAGTKKSVRVLIVEDDADSRDMLKELTQLLGYAAVGAATADEAVAIAERQMPTLALVDIGLAGANGLEVGRKLRQMHGGHEVCLVALTGYSDEGSRSRAKDAGFDDFIVKPLMPDKLTELLSRFG